MICYRDMTFCASPNCKNKCGRKFTDKDRKAAARWWASDNNPTGEGAPIAISYFCGTEIEGFFTEQDFPGFEKQMAFEHRLDCALRANERIAPLLEALSKIAGMRAYRTSAKDMKAIAKKALKR